jgi:hypothetical protein
VSDQEFAWEPLLHTDASPGCRLQGALLTTYERADEQLLAEHLLPLWLNLTRDAGGTGIESQYFLMELHEELKRLSGRLVVVSSVAREPGDQTTERDAGNYAWIWRSIRSLFVGRQGHAIQHAKLWMLHWADEDGGEKLEIVVSSANLTTDAFKGQIQAGWRVCLVLHSKPSMARARSWGILPPFIRELARASGDGDQLDHFLDLLGRADCPKGVTFVASVPGHHTRGDLRRTPWGLPGLARVVPGGRGRVKTYVSAPYVGAWQKDDIQRWCQQLHGDLELVWIRRSHPWARAGYWKMPKSTLTALMAAGVVLVELNYDPEGQFTNLFHREQSVFEARWSHAKVYGIKRGRSARLLVTSANFSQAAWGREGEDGALQIRNFELGVCVEQAEWPLERVCFGFDTSAYIATSEEYSDTVTALIDWAEATWDGVQVDVKVRCSRGNQLRGIVRSGAATSAEAVSELAIEHWAVIEGELLAAAVPWTIERSQPDIVELRCGSEILQVPVFDERVWQDRELALPNGIEGDWAEVIRDEMLFERYGGQVSRDSLDGITEDDYSVESEVGPGTVHRDSFDVAEFVRARGHLHVVDNWAARTRKGALASEVEVVMRDGILLIEAFERQETREKRSGDEGIGAAMAAGEIRQLVALWQVD